MCAVEGGILTVFFRYNFQPEIDSDVMSDVAVDYVGIYIRVKFGDSRSNVSQDTILNYNFRNLP